MQWNLLELETQDVNFEDSDIDLGRTLFGVEFQTIDVTILKSLHTIAKIIELVPHIEIEEDILQDVKINMGPKMEFEVNIEITEVVKGQPSSFMGDEIEEDSWD